MTANPTKPRRKRGGQTLPPGVKRVLVAAKVAPETKKAMDAEKKRTGKSLSRVLDDAVLKAGELDEAMEAVDFLSDILRRTAIALRGPEPELTRWSWHDLPELVSDLKTNKGNANEKNRSL